MIGWDVVLHDVNSDGQPAVHPAVQGALGLDDIVAGGCGRTHDLPRLVHGHAGDLIHFYDFYIAYVGADGIKIGLEDLLASATEEADGTYHLARSVGQFLVELVGIPVEDGIAVGVGVWTRCAALRTLNHWVAEGTVS